MSAAPTGLRRPPVPLLPSLTWVVLSVVRVGDVAVLLVAVLVAGLAELVRFVRVVGDRYPAVRSPAVAAGGLMGLALGAELGFGFGGGQGLALVAATAYLGARAAWLAATIVWSTAASARVPRFGWRRCQVVGVVVSLVLWLLLLAGDEVTDTSTSAVKVHGIRLALPGGSALLLVLIAVSVVAEGVLQYQAYGATEAWLAGRGRRPSMPRRRTVADDLEELGADLDAAAADPSDPEEAPHGPELLVRSDEP